jgi:hypothetical protein
MKATPGVAEMPKGGAMLVVLLSYQHRITNATGNPASGLEPMRLACSG